MLSSNCLNLENGDWGLLEVGEDLQEGDVGVDGGLLTRGLTGGEWNLLNWLLPEMNCIMSIKQLKKPIFDYPTTTSCGYVQVQTDVTV